MENKIYIGIDLHKRFQTWVVLGEKDNIKLLSRTYPVTPDAISRAVSDVKKLGNNFMSLLKAFVYRKII